MSSIGVAEGSQVIDASYVVIVAVGDQQSVYLGHRVSEYLFAEIRSAVNQQCASTLLYHDG